MKTTHDYLDALSSIDRKNGGTGSDYSVAKLLNVSRSCMSSYRRGKTSFDDSMAIRAASLLGVSPGEVLANIHAERSKDDSVRSAWHHVAETLAHSA